MRDYLEYVQSLLRAVREAEDIDPDATDPAPRPTAVSGAGTVLMLSPHPDDEMIVGALPLRLMRQRGMRVVNLSLTLGSKRERQLERFEELKAACASIGFEAGTFGERGLEGINPEAPEADPAHWSRSVDAVAGQMALLRPRAVFYPHAQDANRTHMGAHRLVTEALARAGLPCACFQTEFWSPMNKPNLAVESSAQDVAALVAALALHRGEVARNPYHLRLPMWMMDNVRRGAELVGGQGGEAPRFSFATLYRQGRWNGTRMEHPGPEGLFMEAGSAPRLFGD
ncbi:MAG: PIG-L family deacetylase [Opitutales bacterium]